MHIPSHTLKPEVALSCAAISIPLLSYAFAKARSNPQTREKLPLFAASCAAVLGAQAIDIAIPGGSSAHLLGGALLAIGFGPWLGMLGMAAVFLIQATVFGDGGLDALGANWLNGAVAAPLLGWAAYRHWARTSCSGLRMALAASGAGAISLLAGAALCSAELSISEIGTFTSVLEKMSSGSLAWAALEGGLTGAILLTASASVARFRATRIAALGLCALAVFSLSFGSNISSNRPDVLERTLENSADSAK